MSIKPIYDAIAEKLQRSEFDGLNNLFVRLEDILNTTDNTIEDDYPLSAAEGPWEYHDGYLISPPIRKTFNTRQSARLSINFNIPTRDGMHLNANIMTGTYPAERCVPVCLIAPGGSTLPLIFAVWDYVARVGTNIAVRDGIITPDWVALVFNARDRGPTDPCNVRKNTRKKLPWVVGENGRMVIPEEVRQANERRHKIAMKAATTRMRAVESRFTLLLQQVQKAGMQFDPYRWIISELDGYTDGHILIRHSKWIVNNICTVCDCHVALPYGPALKQNPSYWHRNPFFVHSWHCQTWKHRINVMKRLLGQDGEKKRHGPQFISYILYVHNIRRIYRISDRIAYNYQKLKHLTGGIHAVDLRKEFVIRRKLGLASEEGKKEPERFVSNEDE